ncbi:MAG: C1 family peptidase [Planctomycetota bacterium]
MASEEIIDGLPVLGGRVLSARPDTVDFRDKMYVPTLVEVPAARLLNDYRIAGSDVEVLDQGQEGACCGFALAAVANHLLQTRDNTPDLRPVSARMLYEMAQRHDEWPGENYAGSSARGAVKGWHKYGVCGEEAWPYVVGQKGGRLTHERIQDAKERPLGAYFRVNHRDLVAMHSAITEVGILFATATVHKGWNQVRKNGVIKYHDVPSGGHAFAIVGYDTNGFWIQNSWGSDWGHEGFGHLSYRDWLENGSDVWVTRLGVPVRLDTPMAYTASTYSGTQMGQGISVADLRPHVVSLGNNGLPHHRGGFPNTAEEIGDFITRDFLRLTDNWKKRRILLYAHGGLVREKGAIQRVAEYRESMMRSEVYPLAFIWHSDFWSTLKNIISDARPAAPAEGVLESVGDFLVDRLDGTLETAARFVGGKAQWSEMKENALAATEGRGGGARVVLRALKKVMSRHRDIEVHVAGHSAGSIFMGPVVRQLAKFTNINTCQLWAPACTTDLFKRYYLPHLSGAGRAIREFALYTLSDKAERDDHCARIYRKSLLYLVSRSFEDEYHPLRWGWPGAPLLGMQRFVEADSEIMDLLKNKTASWIVAPNNSRDPLYASDAKSHGAFDDDRATVKGSLQRILGSADVRVAPQFTLSAASGRSRRAQIKRVVRSG